MLCSRFAPLAVCGGSGCLGSLHGVLREPPWLETPCRLTAAWVGDSRAVLGRCSEVGTSSRSHLPAVQLTHDHRPDAVMERARIIRSGGAVHRCRVNAQGLPIGPMRLCFPNTTSPGLALSRAFGDTLAATIGVSDQPEFRGVSFPQPVRIWRSEHEAGTGAMPGGLQDGADGTAMGSSPCQEHQILIVASDGLWDFISNDAALEIAARHKHADHAAAALTRAAQDAWAARFQGRHCDDITVAVAFLPMA